MPAGAGSAEKRLAKRFHGLRAQDERCGDRLKTSHEHIKPALRAFAEMPHVIEVHRLTGDDCFLLKVLIPTPGQLDTIVDTIARFGG